MFLASQAARQEKLLGNDVPQVTGSRSPQAKGIHLDSKTSVDPPEGKDTFRPLSPLLVTLLGLLWLLLTLKYWDIFIPAIIKKKKKGNVPLLPKYLSWWATSKRLFHILLTSHWGIHNPLRYWRTRSKQSDGKNQPTGQAWHLLENKLKPEMHPPPGQGIQPEGLNLLIFRVGWLSTEGANSCQPRSYLLG